MNYQTLIPQVKALIEGVEEIKQVFMYPETKLSKFPAAIILPGRLDNSFETTAENAKTYSFRIWVVVGIGGTTVSNAMATVLPKAVDAVYDTLDAAWDQGAIDGHRVRARLTSEEWRTVVAQDGTTCYAPLTLELRLLTDI